jgi:hypothetical protein
MALSPGIVLAISSGGTVEMSAKGAREMALIGKPAGRDLRERLAGINQGPEDVPDVVEKWRRRFLPSGP